MRRLASLGVFLLAGMGLARAADVGGESCWIRSVASAENKVWVLCDQSRLFVTADYGSTWTPTLLPRAGTLRAVSFQDSRRGWVAGDGGLLLATQDGGFNWRRVEVPTSERLTDIEWQGESGWISGHGGVILHSGDGGRTWTLQKSGVRQPLENLYFLDADHGWAVGWVGTIVRTTNGGHHWEPVPVKRDMMWSLSSVYFRDRQNGWAVGFAGQILRSRDGGVTWEAQESPVKVWLNSVMFDRWGRGWIAADTHLLRSEDGGDTWQAEATQDRMFLSWLTRTDDALWAVGQFGVLKQSPDGLAWRQVRTPGQIDPPPTRYERAASTASVQAPGRGVAR